MKQNNPISKLFEEVYGDSSRLDDNEKIKEP